MATTVRDIGDRSEITVNRDVSPRVVHVRIDHDAHGDVPHKVLGIALTDGAARDLAASLDPAGRPHRVSIEAAARLREIADDLTWIWDSDRYDRANGVRIQAKAIGDLREIAAQLSGGSGGEEERR